MQHIYPLYIAVWETTNSILATGKNHSKMILHSRAWKF